ncbi:hypothetical protein Q3G72_000220 [Acer saccharum]|nr:hypothetical protein Q3G72_000220 [Acer saccharum]
MGIKVAFFLVPVVAETEDWIRAIGHATSLQSSSVGGKEEAGRLLQSNPKAPASPPPPSKERLVMVASACKLFGGFLVVQVEALTVLKGIEMAVDIGLVVVVELIRSKDVVLFELG